MSPAMHGLSADGDRMSSPSAIMLSAQQQKMLRRTMSQNMAIEFGDEDEMIFKRQKTLDALPSASPVSATSSRNRSSV